MNIIGQNLGQYRIVEPVGQGGMATVYRAYQAGLDRYVAVKVLPAQHAETPGFKERFTQEARAVAQLSHPNILPIYDFGIKEGISYFVIKYVPDHTLADLMGQPMELSKVSHFIDQIAGALNHAHERGIVHRDVKPSNILLEGDWLLLADFGLAKIVEGSQVLTATGATLGTPAYISPEQAEGKPADNRSDIYSLGIVLYEMVTGRVPYQGETPVGVIFKHIFEPLPIPRSVNPDLPEAVERVILKAVAKDPNDRYEQASDLAEALRQAMTEAQTDPFALPQTFEATPFPEPDLDAPGGPAPIADPDAPITPPLSEADAAAPLIPAIETSPAARQLPLGAGAILAGVGLLLLLAVGALFLLSGGKDEAATQAPSARPVVQTESGDISSTRTARPSPTVLPTEAVTPEQATTTVPSLIPSPTVADVTSVPLSDGAISADNAHQIEELTRLGRGTIDALAISPDGKTLAVAGSLGVWLYDAETLETLGLLEGHEKPVQGVAWSSNGAQLATAGKDGAIIVWQFPTREEQRLLQGHVGSVTSVAWSPDDTQLVSGGWDDTVRVWEVASGRETHTLTGHTEAVLHVAWSPDGSQLASAGRDNTVRLWDVKNNREMAMLEGHTDSVGDVDWSPDGSQLASASDDETVQVWTAYGERVHVLQGHTSYVRSVVWSSDGTQLASGALDKTVRIWDAGQGTELRALKGHTKPVQGVAWSADGAQLVSGADDGTLRIWDVATGRELAVLDEHADAILSVAWSPDGMRLASGDENGIVQIWHAAEALRIHRLTGHRSEINGVAWSPDGTQLASGGGIFDNAVFLWDPVAGGAPLVLQGHSSMVSSVAWSPDGTQLASAGWDNTIWIWDVAGRPIETLTGHTDWILSVAWSPDGTKLASGSKDGTVRVWNAATGEQVYALQGHTDQVTSVAWSPDGSRLVSASWDDTLRIWLLAPSSDGDGASGGELMVLQTPGSVTSVAWSPDGSLLATAAAFLDNTVRIWDTASGRELHVLEGHLDYVTSVAWSPDGEHLATGSEDGTMRVWGILGDR